MPNALLRQTDLFEAFPVTCDLRLAKLRTAFADRKLQSTLLPLAERAIAACPDHPGIICMAATAALLGDRPQYALVLLQRVSRIDKTPNVHLLLALALHGINQGAAARALLIEHKLTHWPQALPVFPGGDEHLAWLITKLDAIMGQAMPDAGRRPAVPPARYGTHQTKSQPRLAKKPAARPSAAAPSPGSEQAPPSLPRMAIDIPFSLDVDFTTLSAAAAHTAEHDGRWFDLRERAAHFSLAQGFDELLCMPHLIGFEPLRHQIETVRKVLKQFRGRVLLADEVGLGKTIEACMVLAEYALRGMAERTLVLTPASLVGQWHEELESKFRLTFATTYDALLREEPSAFWDQKRIVASIATARRREHAACLLGRQFDLVIVDEAHHLRDRSSQSWKLVDALKKRFLLLLSATPVQNDLIELYNLLTLLKPGIFKTLREFRATYMTPGKPRQPANSEHLRALMRDAMIRNTRAVVALKLPRRQATTIKVDGTPREAEAYADLTAAVRGMVAQGGAARQRMALHHLLSAAGSSPAAAMNALARMAERNAGDAVWARLAEQWGALKRGGKEEALIELVGRNREEKKLVFVNSRRTLAALADRLTGAGISCARFEGSMSGPEKDAAIAAFREQATILLCTQAGGEGRNIQFCNTLINFDVPWNPMAIEQRIGRIDRIGQAREVFVFNLVTRGTLEEQILMLLDEKISMFELVVGEVGAILGGLEEEREFPDLVLDAWLQTTEASRTQAFDELGARLDDARRQHQGAKVLDEKLFGEDFEAA
jgi:superfamily II DNA or RNA helicase